MAEIKITKENFKTEVLDSPIPVLVDFWATWCGPCRMLSPVVAEIAEENEGTVKVGKVNVDEEPELAAQFGINAIPAVLVFRGGELAATAVGYRPKAQLLELVK